MLLRNRHDQSADIPSSSRAGRPRRIGVLTFHRCINYGSYWQARCLVSGLRAWGHHAVLLDHHGPAAQRAEWACALQPLLPRRSAREDRLRYAEKVRAFARAQARLPLSSRFALDQGPSERFDAILVGSDEVWNQSHPWYGGEGLFWGDRLGGVPLIAHAASSGNHTWAWSPDRAAKLAHFESIAVRDTTTRDHVRAATGKVPPLVLDPCLQFPPEPAAPLRRAPYAVVYGHDFPEWAAAAARAWAARNRLQLLSLGYRNDFADVQWLEAGPAGFAAAVSGAAAMITTMFHGTVFALNARLPFAAIPSPYRTTKVSDLTALLGADAHHAAQPDELDRALARPPDPAITGAIAALRASSHATLRHALA